MQMIIRCLIKFYKHRWEWLEMTVPMTPTERELLHELFTQKNYRPRTDRHRYRSFNAHFKEWLFRQKPFAKSFNIFYGNILN